MTYWEQRPFTVWSKTVCRIYWGTSHKASVDLIYGFRALVSGMPYSLPACLQPVNKRSSRHDKWSSGQIGAKQSYHINGTWKLIDWRTLGFTHLRVVQWARILEVTEIHNFKMQWQGHMKKMAATYQCQTTQLWMKEIPKAIPHNLNLDTLFSLKSSDVSWVIKYANCQLNGTTVLWVPSTPPIACWN